MLDDRGPGWLWDGAGVFRERHAKSAAVIAAVARVLEADDPVGVAGRRLVTAFRQFEACSPQTRERLAGEPYAYFWGRLSYELLRAVLRPDSPTGGLARHYCNSRNLEAREALTGHLGEFARLLTAAAVLDGSDLELNEPLVVDGPFALPGTPLGVDGEKRFLVHGVDKGALRITGAGTSSCPLVDYEGCECRLQPAAFNVPVSGVSDDTWRAGRDFQRRHSGRIEDALALLHRLDGAAFDQVRAGLRILALRPQGQPGELTNVSHCDLPGAISIALCEHPYELVNVIWHELLHNRLFALEEKESFLVSPDPNTRTEDGFYSPWRRDYRPAHGLLHAVYVFTGIGRYWASVVRAADTPEPVRELARARILQGLYQVRLGLALLHRQARFTSHGRRLMDSLRAEHESLWHLAGSIELKPDLPYVAFRPGTTFDIEIRDGTIRGHVKRHLRRYGKAEHVEYLEPLLAWPDNVRVGRGDKGRRRA